MNIQSWLPLRLTSLISLLSKGQYSFESNSSLVLSLHYDQILQPYVTTEKIIALTIQTFVGKMMFLFLNMLSRSITALWKYKSRAIGSSVFGLIVVDAVMGQQTCYQV